MTDEDQHLRDLFDMDGPPASDPLFVLEALRRVQVRQMWLELGGGGVTICAACTVLWALAPCLESLSRPTAALMSALAPAASLAISVFYLLSPRALAARS